MPLDPRMMLLAGNVPQADPFAFQKGQAAALQLQSAQRQGQVEQMQLAEAQRQEQERGTLARAFRGALTTDPTTGATTVDVPRAFTAAYRATSDPASVLKAQQAYTTTQAESAKDALAAQKDLLEQRLKGLEFGGQVARGVEAQIAAGADPQQAWQWGIQTMAGAGYPIQGVPPTYDASFLARWQAAGLAQKDALTQQQKVVDQQLREREVAGTERRTDVMAADITERRAEREQTRTGSQQERTFQRENTLRDEYRDLTKNYREVRDAWGRIETTGASTAPTVANDYALIYSFMKMLDPMTGIRDAETRNAVEAGGLPAQTQRWIEWVQGHKILPDNIRQQFVETGKRLYDQYTREYDRTTQQYAGMAQRYGVDPANVTQDFRATPVPRPDAQAGGARTLSEADIQRTMQASGKTRAEVLEAARAKGYSVPAR